MPDHPDDGVPPPPGLAPAGTDVLAEQIVRYLAGQLSAAEVTALGAALHADPAARDLFVRMCLLESRLVEKFAPGRRELVSDLVLDDVADAAADGDSRTRAVAMPAIVAGRIGGGPAGAGDDDDDESAVVAHGGTPPEWRPRVVATGRRPWRWAAAGLAAAVLVGVGTWAIVRSPNEDDNITVGGRRLARVTPGTTRATPELPPPVVATVGGAVGAEWDGAPLASGAAVRAGTPLSLRAGWVELRLAGGATVAVEGPAQASVVGPGRVELSAGRLTAVVPPPARGFAVRTPTAEVVDLGTEFGVGVTGPGTAETKAGTDVLVFQGKVEVGAPAGPSSPFAAGQAARVDSSGAVASAPPDLRAFVRVAEVQARVRAAVAGGSGYDRWLAHRYATARDPDLVAYYPLDGDDQAAAPTALLNRSAAGGLLDGALTDNRNGPGPRWATGRWPQKRGLAFNGPDRPRVRLPAAGPAMDFSAGAAAAAGASTAAGGATTTGGSAAATGPSPFTILAWVRPEAADPPLPSATAGGTVLARGGGYAEQFALEFDASAARAFVRDRPAVDAKPNARVAPAVANAPVAGGPGAWHLVGSVYDPAASRLALYLDGEPAAVVPAPRALAASPGPLLVGARPNPAGVYEAPLAGTLDELAVYRRAMSAAEVRRQYDAGKP